MQLLTDRITIIGPACLYRQRQHTDARHTDIAILSVRQSRSGILSKTLNILS